MFIPTGAQQLGRKYTII